MFSPFAAGFGLDPTTVDSTISPFFVFVFTSFALSGVVYVPGKLNLSSVWYDGRCEYILIIVTSGELGVTPGMLIYLALATRMKRSPLPP